MLVKLTSSMLRRSTTTLLLLSGVVLAAAVSAANLTPEDFFGTYVGRAQVYDADGHLEGERDVDVLIEGEKRGGFRTTTVVVELVEGRRDVQGVKRSVIESRFAPGSGALFLESERGSLFSKRKAPDPLAGDALRWARVKGSTLTMVSFGILEDGRYELQITDRTLTKDGIDLSYRRYVDGTFVRSIKGATIKVD